MVLQVDTVCAELFYGEERNTSLIICHQWVYYYLCKSNKEANTNQTVVNTIPVHPPVRMLADGKQDK